MTDRRWIVYSMFGLTVHGLADTKDSEVYDDFLTNTRRSSENAGLYRVYDLHRHMPVMVAAFYNGDQVPVGSVLQGTEFEYHSDRFNPKVA